MPSTTLRPGAALRVPEEKLALAGASGAAVVALPAVAIAWAVEGIGAAVPVAGGALLVAVLALAALPLYRLGAAAGNEMVVAMSMAALGLRMLLALVVFAALSYLTAVPMVPFAIGLAAGLVASIGAEMATAARDPRFFWVSNPTPATPAPHSSSGTERQHA